MELNVNIRAGEKARQLIKIGLVPAIVYGKHLDKPVTISVSKNDFIKKYKEAGYSTPITLQGNGVDQMVLIHDLQLDPVTDNLIHVDFLAVSKDEKVTTEVPVIIVGESSVEKLGQGRIQLIKDMIEVEALPGDLPHNVTIDISVIKNNNDTIFLRDIKVSDKVAILEDLDQPVVTVLSLTEEEVDAPAATATATATPTATTAAPAKKQEKK